MNGQFQIEMDVLAGWHHFTTKPMTAECPYCGSTFRPVWCPPTKDEFWGHYRRFCSRVCKKFWDEEKRDEVPI